MSVKKRPDRELYRVSWREPSTGKVRSRNFKKEADAIAFDYRLKAARADGAQSPDQPVTGTSFAEIALRSYADRAHSMTESTIRSDLYTLRNSILPVIGAIPAERLTRQDMDKLVAALRAGGNKANTIGRKWTLIRAILNWAVEKEILPANPVRGYKLPSGNDEIIMPPSVAEVEAILAHAPPFLRRAVLLTFYLGLRPGQSELLRLTWLDVDLAEGVVRVTSALKGGLRWREVPIQKSLIPEIARWHAEDGGRGYIIQEPEGGRGRCLEAWNVAKVKAGITRRLRLYDLRHAFATYAIGGGADIKSVADIMGHASPSMTLRTYQHALSRNKRQAVELVPTLGTTSGATTGQKDAIISQPDDNKIQ